MDSKMVLITARMIIKELLRVIQPDQTELRERLETYIPFSTTRFWWDDLLRTLSRWMDVPFYMEYSREVTSLNRRVNWRFAVGRILKKYYPEEKVENLDWVKDGF